MFTMNGWTFFGTESKVQAMGLVGWILRPHLFKDREYLRYFTLLLTLTMLINKPLISSR